MTNYPCKDCIVKCNCSDLCPNTLWRNDFKSLIKDECCPDCGGKVFDAHRIVITFIVISCRSCRSRFTLEVYKDHIDICRSTKVKGSIGKGKTDRDKRKAYTTYMLDKFINDIKDGGWIK
jgi:hypothetical protein